MVYYYYYYYYIHPSLTSSYPHASAPYYAVGIITPAYTYSLLGHPQSSIDQHTFQCSQSSILSVIVSTSISHPPSAATCKPRYCRRFSIVSFEGMFLTNKCMCMYRSYIINLLRCKYSYLGRVVDCSFLDCLGSFCFLLNEFHCTLSFSYKILTKDVYYYYCILIRIV